MKKQARRKRVVKRSFRKARDVPEWASCSETRSLALAGGAQYNSNALYSLMNTQLLSFNRATVIANAYQHYRIKKITLKIKPSFDSYIATGGGTSKANLYYMIDKSGSVPTNITLEGLKSMGAKPRALDERPISISWRPSVLEGVMYAPTVIGAMSASKYRISPWLATNASPVFPAPFVPSGVDHLGIYWYVDQLANPNGQQYSVECEVQFEFKKPLETGMYSSTHAIPATLAELNDSPDGIVGGGDGV